MINACYDYTDAERERGKGVRRGQGVGGLLAQEKLGGGRVEHLAAVTYAHVGENRQLHLGTIDLLVHGDSAALGHLLALTRKSRSHVRAHRHFHERIAQLVWQRGHAANYETVAYLAPHHSERIAAHREVVAQSAKVVRHRSRVQHRGVLHQIAAWIGIGVHLCFFFQPFQLGPELE